jgi:D-sedoheptulose 7-phosphate isomerase
MYDMLYLATYIHTMSQIAGIMQKALDVKAALMNNEQQIGVIQSVVDVCVEAFKGGNKVLFCGNGGSAADAQHLAAEFSGRFYKDRKALPSEALHVNTSYLTAVGNDYGYEFVYSRLLEGIGQKGDVLVGISTSGNSKNIINALTVANSIGMHTVTFTGEHGGLMAGMAQHAVKVPSNDTPRIQECHILVGHIICELVEAELF